MPILDLAGFAIYWHLQWPCPPERSEGSEADGLKRLTVFNPAWCSIQGLDLRYPIT